MNICFINFNKRWRGVKIWTLDYGKMLMERGHSVTAIVRSDNEFEKACREAGFDVYAFRPGMKYNPMSIYRILKILNKKQIDAAVVNISKDLNIGAVACKLAGVPVFHRVGLESDFKHTKEEKRLHNLMAGIIVPSHHLKKELMNFGWLTKEIYVLHNSKIADHYREYKNKTEGPFYIGVTSFLTPSKGHIYLLEALKKLVDQNVPVRLRIAGDGDTKTKLESFVLEHGLEDYVEFAGFQRNIPKFLENIDIFVLPSLAESFGNTLLEAMFAGLPCIAFDTGGIPEVMGGTGILSPVKDVDALAENIRKVAGSFELRAELSKKARERALRVYDLKVNVERLESILKGEIK